MADETKNIQKQEADVPIEGERTKNKTYFVPVVDIYERQNDIMLVADLPGVDENSVDVTLEKNVLTIAGKVDPAVFEGYSMTYAEYGIGDFERSFTLSEEIDRTRIEAVVKNGVLRLTLPKSEPAKARKITVNAG